MPRYFLLHKPYDVLSQFTRELPSHRVLADIFPFPRGVYPVGRLDRDSEGLLIVTDDKSLNNGILHPSNRHLRTYWVQVEGVPGPAPLDRLRQGVTIRAKGKTHRCAPVKVQRLPGAVSATIDPRDPPIRIRKTVPDAWLSVGLTEGKNRQVRRMCAAVGHPVLRLIRHAIETVTLDDLAGATVREVDREWLYPRLRL